MLLSTHVGVQKFHHFPFKFRDNRSSENLVSARQITWRHTTLNHNLHSNILLNPCQEF